MFKELLENAELRRAAELLADGAAAVNVSGQWGSSSAMTAGLLGHIARRPVLLLVAHVDNADDAADDIEVLTGRAAELFPAWEADAAADHINDEIVGQRIGVCNLLAGVRQAGEGAGTQTGRKEGGNGGDKSQPPIIVASMLALLQPVPTAEELGKSRLSLSLNQTIDPEELSKWLVGAGYEHVDQVDAHSQFARRGGIVDVLTPGTSLAVRIEFFGDKIESIRTFDPDIQRSSEQIGRFDILSLLSGRGGQKGRPASLLDYLPADTLVCLHEPGKLAELAGQLYDRIHNDLAEPGSADRLLRPGEVLSALEKFQRVGLNVFGQSDEIPSISLGVKSLERLSINPQEALAELESLSETHQVWVFCENPSEQDRFLQLMRTDRPVFGMRVRTAIGHVHGGFCWPAAKLAIVGHHEIYQRYALARRVRRVRAGRPIESLLDLREGDYVVHVGHGIAKYEGLRMLQNEGRSEEFLRLRFADNAILHVAAGNINLVQKYVGSKGRRPSLSHLGGTRWANQKLKVAEAVKDLAVDLLRVQAMRKAMPGVSFPSDTPLQRQFCGEFIYTETADQLAAMAQIDSDMADARPMDRLLCGDVGYGKTELAMRAAFRVVEAGRQAAVLVPTTVLADQHRRTFGERFADYPVLIECISRLRTAGEQADIIGRLGDKKVDILIGTHRLLSKDVRFADLGLVIIDEEQRFGVEHKEHLKRLRATVDVLTMTATPIPRTMHMSLLGLKDISSLATPPMDRRAIHTEVRQYDQAFIRHVILRELSRQGQIFFVHNRVLDIDELVAGLAQLVPEARVAVAHGQMPEGRLEETMLRFVRQNADVLVCTTIIESGLDIPTANTMIVHDADRFGLAQLHQLRGRVGRYKHKAFCYLLLPQTRVIRGEALKRLKTIEDFSDLGAGFQIAMRDLEIRGAGNLLGAEQSGHIAAVGYEMYCQILQQTVNAMRGEQAAAIVEAVVQLDVEACLPQSYIQSDRQRMEIYRRIGRCTGPADVDAVRHDIQDAFGRPPELTAALLDLAEVRLLAGRLGIEGIRHMPPDIVFQFAGFAKADKIFHGVKGSVRLIDEKTVYWRPPARLMDPRTILEVILKQLRNAAKKV
ncbi:MAG: transcription-repair coupling factor [Planctomycetes bacterium]|nr:transcription-repair coupling factor [Planctomycetota bacterium]